MKKIFDAKATNTGGRTGNVRSGDGTLDFKVEMPTNTQKTTPGTTNPEELFAAAYATCFAGALQHVAKEKTIEDLGNFNVAATVSFNKDEDGFFLEVILDSYLPTLSKEKGEELVNGAHEICPYSNATRDNITVHLNLMMD